MAPDSSATINASISYAGKVQGIFLLANRGSSIGPSKITLSSGWGGAASVTASGTTAANPTIAINFTKYLAADADFYLQDGCWNRRRR